MSLKTSSGSHVKRASITLLYFMNLWRFVGAGNFINVLDGLGLFRLWCENAMFSSFHPLNRTSTWKKKYIMLTCAHFGCRLMVFGIKRIKKYSKINVKSNVLHVKKSSWTINSQWEMPTNCYRRKKVGNLPQLREIIWSELKTIWKR